MVADLHAEAPVIHRKYTGTHRSVQRKKTEPLPRLPAPLTLPGSVRMIAAMAGSGVTQIYVSLNAEDRIARFVMDPEHGTLEPMQSFSVSGAPAPLATDPAQRTLFVGRRGICQISSYRIQPGTGDLYPLSSVGLDSDPNFLATDRRGRFLFSAYYRGGGIGVHEIDGDGVIRDPAVAWLATGTGAHSLQTDASNRFAYALHIAGGHGPNAVFQYLFDEDSGRLQPNSPLTVVAADEAGPRHFCFHPSLGLFYASNEQGCSVTAYRIDAAKGTVSPVHTISTLPEEFTGHNTCAQIKILPNGRFLYVGNRGHNSIAGFAIAADGSLGPAGHVEADPVPRAFAADPNGRFLLVAGLETGGLRSYRIDERTGGLTPGQSYAVGESPMWVLPVTLSS